MGLRYAHIVGWGMHVPRTVLTNKDLEAIIDTNDEWIKARTGIHERRIANEKETTAYLGLKAAQQALEITHILPSEIDLVVVATSTPENIFPSTASMIQHWLGAKNAGAYDLSAACSGFVYGIDMATQAIRSGSIDTAIVIGTETMSRVMDWNDRSTCILFGDGAGAVVLQASETPGGVLSSVLRSDGSGHDMLGVPTFNHPDVRSPEGIGEHKLHKMYMSGREVFKFATRVIGDTILEVCKRADIKLSDVSLIVPHQANERIIQAAARSLNLEDEKFMMNLDRYGNTSAASIPIAFYEAIQSGRIRAGDYIVFIGFGGGLTWGATVIKWGIPEPEDHSANLRYRGRRQASYLWVRITSVLRRWSRLFNGRLPSRNKSDNLE